MKKLFTMAVIATIILGSASETYSQSKKAKKSGVLVPNYEGKEVVTSPQGVNLDDTLSSNELERPKVYNISKYTFIKPLEVPKVEDISTLLQGQQQDSSMQKSVGEVINGSEKDYRNILFLKLNKNKGYNKQGFEVEESYALLEKRVSYASFNLGFRSMDINNLWVEPIAVVDKVYNRNFSAQVAAGYFVKNNVALGFKFSYGFNDVRLRINADILDIVIGAKTYETNNASSTVTGAFVLKNFIPIDKGHRIFIVSETSLGYSYTHSLAKNYYDAGAKIHKVETVRNAYSVGISPGFMYFMTRGFAFEFAMNPVVAYYEKSTKTNNEVQDSDVTSYGLSFKFMPFNIQFGFSYFFGLDYYKNREHVERLKQSRY